MPLQLSLEDLLQNPDPKLGQGNRAVACWLGGILACLQEWADQGDEIDVGDASLLDDFAEENMKHGGYGITGFLGQHRGDT